jgi:hypothetical protein
MLPRLLARLARSLPLWTLAIACGSAWAGPRFCITGDTLLFGNRVVGTTTHATASVSNCGDAAWSFTSVQLHTATNPEFHVDSACASGATLAPGASCTVDVAFAPTVAGEVSGALWLHNSTSTPDQLLTFYGRGIDAQAGSAALFFTPGTANFGTVTVGTQAGPLVVTLTNTGSAALTPSALVLNGAQPYDFQTVSYGDSGDCAVGRAIASGASCRMNVYFRPQQPGSRSAKIVVDAPQLASLAIMSIGGTGVAPDAGVVDVVEFQHPADGQYFLTADAAETALLDGGGLPGWTRTGAQFRAWRSDATTIGVDAPVCRFFGVPGVGPNSHFYTASASECSAVRADPHWIDEGVAFRVALLANGVCSPGYRPVTRLWWPGEDVTRTRHRYVVDPALVEPMRAAGWVVEGPVFCGLP